MRNFVSTLIKGPVMRIGYVVVVLFAVIAAYVYWYANPSPRLLRLRHDVGRVVDSLASRRPNDPNVRRLVARFDPANIYEPLYGGTQVFNKRTIYVCMRPIPRCRRRTTEWGRCWRRCTRSLT